DGRRYRLLDRGDADGRELFDATADPNELVDLYGDSAYAGIQAELEELLDRMVADAATGGPARSW
ncbi:MAG: DUF4976 domain-containing protein, partial [Myxococcota bacterium]|nr:DUF4976 domain-containing protein [Myxococcota bacterium]